MRGVRVSAAELRNSYTSAVARLGVRNVPPGGEATVKAILDELPDRARLVVDIGCNVGWVTSEVARALPATEVVGVDVSTEMIETARQSYVAENLRFLVGDVEELDRLFHSIDAVVCAGSSVFFPSRSEGLAAIARCLDAEGCLVDCNYVYEPATPQSLRMTEAVQIGVAEVSYSAGECVAAYERAGLALRRYRRLPWWRPEDAPDADLYRSLLANVPGMAKLVSAATSARTLARALAPYRQAVLVVADRPTDAATSSEPSSHDIDSILQVMQLFRAPFAPQPIERLRAMLPYEFLAYVGDPDAAPGGAASVAKSAALLGELGVPDDGSVLDVGCFTGMSTFALAQSHAGHWDRYRAGARRRRHDDRARAWQPRVVPRAERRGNGIPCRIVRRNRDDRNSRIHVESAWARGRSGASAQGRRLPRRVPLPLSGHLGRGGKEGNERSQSAHSPGPALREAWSDRGVRTATRAIRAHAERCDRRGAGRRRLRGCDGG